RNEYRGDMSVDADRARSDEVTRRYSLGGIVIGVASEVDHIVGIFGTWLHAHLRPHHLVSLLENLDRLFEEHAEVIELLLRTLRRQLLQQPVADRKSTRLN